MWDVVEPHTFITTLEILFIILSVGQTIFSHRHFLPTCRKRNLEEFPFFVPSESLQVADGQGLVKKVNRTGTA
jgi:hypothetical protein